MKRLQAQQMNMKRLQPQQKVICSDAFFDASINALHDIRHLAIKALKRKLGFDASASIINEALISNTAKLSKLSGRELNNVTGIFNR